MAAVSESRAASPFAAGGRASAARTAIDQTLSCLISSPAVEFADLAADNPDAAYEDQDPHHRRKRRPPHGRREGAKWTLAARIPVISRRSQPAPTTPPRSQRWTR